MKSARAKAIKDAAQALSDLNTFVIVVSILEGGHLHSPSNTDAQRIIRICQRAQQHRLADYDRAIARAEKPAALASGARPDE